jgi:hypothetical protein
LKGGQPEAGHAQRVIRYANDWTEAIEHELWPMLDQGLKEVSPGSTVYSERDFGTPDIAFQHDSGAVVERMREGRVAMYPMQPMI